MYGSALLFHRVCVWFPLLLLLLSAFVFPVVFWQGTAAKREKSEQRRAERGGEGADRAHTEEGRSADKSKWSAVCVPRSLCGRDAGPLGAFGSLWLRPWGARCSGPTPLPLSKPQHHTPKGRSTIEGREMLTKEE
jgi:hypothetical protein